MLFDVRMLLLRCHCLRLPALLMLLQVDVPVVDVLLLQVDVPVIDVLLLQVDVPVFVVLLLPVCHC